MASDSLIGAVGTNLSPESKALLQTVVGQISGDAAVIKVGDSTAVFGTDAGGAITGVLPAGNAPVVGDLRDTNFAVSVDLPANVGISFRGPTTDVSVEKAADYFNSLITQAFANAGSSPAVQAVKQSLDAAVDLVKNVAAAGSNTTVRYVEPTTGNQATATGEVKIVGKGASAEVVAINTGNMAPNQKLVIQDLEKVIIVNKADVVVAGTKAALVVGDNSNQKITGGQGADTLVGGGGSDTLLGGAGKDTFGFVSGGDFVIGDLNPGQDKLAFNIKGVTTLQDLGKLVTKVEETSAGVKYTFGSAASITLVGVKGADITADLITFKIEGDS